MELQRLKRNIAIGVVVFCITLGNYFHLTGTESIRPITIVTLMTCGIAIGVILVNVGFYLKSRKEE